jgi:hypothetical protein
VKVGGEIGAKPEERWSTSNITIAAWPETVADVTPIGHKLGSKLEVFVNKFLKSLLKIGLDFLEESERASSAIRRPEDHTVANAISFAAGIGLGIGIAILLAPASGEETRSSIAEKVQDVGEKVGDRFSPKMKKPATGTEGK